MPDVGIVMPVYKQKPSFLRAALQSVLKQSYSNFRFIIVVDGAPEMYGFIDDEVRHDRRVSVIMNERNRGVAKTLNDGFRHLFEDSDIHYLTWVSSDNIYYPDFIRSLRKRLKQGSEQLGLVYSCYRAIDDNDKPVFDDLHTEGMKVYQAKPKEELLNYCTIGTSFMYKSKYAKAIDGYHMEPVEDYEYWLRLTELCEIDYIPEVLMDYRVDSHYSVSAQLKSDQQHRRWRTAYQIAKYQARQRRNIPYETTILHPINNASPEAMALLESVLEQYYHNYRLLVLDLSPDGQVARPLSGISDPRIEYRAMPGMGERAAIVRVLRNIHTPYTMVFGNEKMWMYDVYWLHEQLHKAPDYPISAYFTPGHASIAFRTEARLHEPFYNELYRTNKLKKVLGIRP